VANCVCGYPGEEFCCLLVWDGECVSLMQKLNCASCAGNGIPDECETDCNGNGVPDVCDLAAATSPDCQGNTVPDECETDCNCNGVADAEDISQGTATDCNTDGIPDECGCAADVVFVVDSSGSMVYEGDLGTVCPALYEVVGQLRQLRVRFRATLLGMAVDPNAMGSDLGSCVVTLGAAHRNRLENRLPSPAVPGNPGSCGPTLAPMGAEDDRENWGPATAAIAAGFDWLPGAVRVVVPVTDEGPCLGSPCGETRDQEAMENAIAVATAHGVHVCPITGYPKTDLSEITCTERFAEQIAEATGGRAVPIRTIPPEDLAFEITQAIAKTISAACGDCDANGVPGACEPDCNENGKADDCDIESGTSEDCNLNGLPDECEGGAEPLFVVVLEEPPQPLRFWVRPLSAYKFEYDPARITLWDSPTRDHLIAPGQIFTAPSYPSGSSVGDGGGGGGTLTIDPATATQQELQLLVAFGFCRVPPVVVQSDQGGSGSPTDPYSCDPNDGGIVLVPVTVYVEGVTVSTALKDTTIRLLADAPPVDGEFTLADFKPVTVARITISPTTGRLGTPITIQLEPAIWPLAFDCQSTVQWEGVYQPLLGPPTAPFQVAYTSEQVCRTSAGEAVIHLGEGTFNNAPDVSQITGLGILVGSGTLKLPADWLRRSFSFAPELQISEWRTIEYPDEYITGGPPQLGGPPQSFDLLELVPCFINHTTMLASGRGGCR
jgi:hypothetical protein